MFVRDLPFASCPVRLRARQIVATQVGRGGVASVDWLCGARFL